MKATNDDLASERLPIRLVNLGTVWTVIFTQPDRFNWLLQYYMRAEGVTLSWVGTGRCLASMDYRDEDYRTLQTMIVDAARAMNRDGSWPDAGDIPERDRRMRARLVREVVGSVIQVPEPLRAFYAAVMQRKEDDHRASHSHRGNQALHLLSSSVFVYCYFLVFHDITTAMTLGLTALFVRQFGHAILEPPCHDAESLLLGFTTRAKTLVVVGYGLIFLAAWLGAGGWSRASWESLAPPIALNWFRWTVLVVLSRVVYLTWKYDFRISMIWFVKLVTDPFTDLVTYRPWRPQNA